MNNILKSICILGLLTGSTLALSPEEKLNKLNNAFADGNIEEGEKWGYSMLQDGDAESIRLLVDYFNDIGYAPQLQKAVRKKAAEMNLSTAEAAPTEGAPWRLYAIPLDNEYETLSAENDAEGIRELGLQLYHRAENATQRYGIGLLYVAASMGDTVATQQLATMYRTGTNVPKDEESAEYLTHWMNDPTTCNHSALHEVFCNCLGTPDIIREKGVDYAEGRNGETKDENKAIVLYQMAADMGDANAARWMGWRYLQGRGVKKDRKLAELYFTIAAIQGDPRAQEALKQQFGKKIEATN